MIQLLLHFQLFRQKMWRKKYNYIKDFINHDYTFLAFLDTPLPSNDPRGTYYLSSNLGNEYLLKVHCAIQLLSNGSMNDVYLLGSSKGGVGALLLGLKYNYVNIIVNAPQALLADYIKTRSLEILSHMLGDNDVLKEINYHQLNNFLLNSIANAKRDLPWNIHITCGQEDGYHLKALDILKDAFLKVNIPLTTTLVRGGHDNIAIDDYRAYFKNLIDGQNIE